jgi:hypothetical protein
MFTEIAQITEKQLKRLPLFGAIIFLDKTWKLMNVKGLMFTLTSQIIEWNVGVLQSIKWNAQYLFWLEIILKKEKLSLVWWTPQNTKLRIPFLLELNQFFTLFFSIFLLCNKQSWHPWRKGERWILIFRKFKIDLKKMHNNYKKRWHSATIVVSMFFSYRCFVFAFIFNSFCIILSFL